MNDRLFINQKACNIFVVIMHVLIGQKPESYCTKNSLQRSVVLLINIKTNVDK